MTEEQFRQAFRKEIAEVLARITRRYSVTDEEMAAALYRSVKKYLPQIAEATDELRSQALARAIVHQVTELMASLNCDDLCLAVACAKGDESAWEDFFRQYRSYLLSVAHTVTQDAATAELLADSTFAELYGLRESDGARVSKFSFYSGRGSLRGWLRAVVLQLAADMHRQSSRFVQEEDSEMDRLTYTSQAERSSVEITFIRDRYRAAVSDALRRAIAQLEPRERLLLALYYYDELTLREIGQMFAVHEATVSRWIAKAQKRARKFVERSLARDHQFNRREIIEAFELAAEQLDINLREYLFERLPSDRSREKAAEGI
jgi:RNA polymerase sigma-70 factor (ECF subfamily)